MTSGWTRRGLERIRGGMAIPTVFSPVTIDGRLLVDGGVSDNLPVDVVRAMGADVVIVVDLGAPLSSREELGGFLSLSGLPDGALRGRSFGIARIGTYAEVRENLYLGGLLEAGNA